VEGVSLSGTLITVARYELPASANGRWRGKTHFFSSLFPLIFGIFKIVNSVKVR